MKLPDRGHAPRKPADDFVAAEEAGRLSERAAAALARADGVDWYEENGTAIDEAAFALAGSRRAQAGLSGGPQHGDEAVRRVLEQASPEAVRLARKPRRLVHGRVGLPGGGRALVPGPARPARLIASSLAVAAPEQERERQEDRAGEVRREREPVPLLPLHDRRARRRARSAPPRSLRRARPRRRRGRRACRLRRRGCSRERGSGLYCGSGWFPSKTRSSPFQTWRKIVSTPGGRRKAARDLRPGDRDALAVGDHEDQPVARRSA